MDGSPAVPTFNSRCLMCLKRHSLSSSLFLHQSAKGLHVHLPARQGGRFRGAPRCHMDNAVPASPIPLRAHILDGGVCLHTGGRKNSWQVAMDASSGRGGFSLGLAANPVALDLHAVPLALTLAAIPLPLDLHVIALALTLAANPLPLDLHSRRPSCSQPSRHRPLATRLLPARSQPYLHVTPSLSLSLTLAANPLPLDLPR